jgi:hypothetical protein
MTFVAAQPTGAFRSSFSIAAFVCLAASPAANLTGCVAQVPPAATTQASWTRPVDLEGVPANHAIRWPILTSLHDTVYVAANIYPVPLIGQGRPVGERPIYLARLPGGAIPAPPGPFQFIYPKILKAPNGDLHMVWAERDSVVPQALSWPGPLQNALWHAVFARGRWSTPTEIFRASALEWTTDDGHLALDGSGSLHAVVWRSESGQNAGIMHLRRDAASWHSELIPSSLGHEHAAVLAFGDSVLFAFVGNSFDASDTTGVTVLRSVDRGGVWSPPVVIHRLGARFASHPQFIRLGAKTLLVWGEKAPGNFALDSIRVVQLDESLRPIPVAAVSLPSGANTFSVTATPCGELSFLVGTLSFSPLPQTFEVTVAANGAVSQRLLRPPEELVTGAAAGATSTSLVAVELIVTQPLNQIHNVVMRRPSVLCKPVNQVR